MSSLRNWNAKHYREKMGDLSGRTLQNELLAECEITGLARAVLRDCDLRGTRVNIDDLRRLLGVTVTLDCYTFSGLVLSELVFDAFLFLLSLTEGNDDKRDRVRSIINPRHLLYLQRAFDCLG